MLLTFYRRLMELGPYNIRNPLVKASAAR